VTRAERRRAVQARRARLLVAGAVAVSVLVLVAWFPASALYHQHRELASSSAQLSQLDQQNHALLQEKERLASTSEVARIARQQYQLVSPGQQAYEVLPPNGSGGSAAYPGDPGLQSPVTPSVASELPPGALPTPAGSSRGTGASHGRTRSAARPGLAERIVQALEFWR